MKGDKELQSVASDLGVKQHAGELESHANSKIADLSKQILSLL